MLLPPAKPGLGEPLGGSGTESAASGELGHAHEAVPSAPQGLRTTAYHDPKPNYAGGSSMGGHRCGGTRRVPPSTTRCEDMT